MLQGVVQTALRTSLGAQIVPDDQFDGDAKFVLGVMTTATVNHANTNHLRIGLGVTDGVRQALISAYDQHGVLDSVVRRSHTSAAFIGLIPDGNNFDPIASATLGDEGLELDIEDAQSAYLLNTLTVGGDDVTRNLIEVTMNGTTPVVVTHSLGGSTSEYLFLFWAHGGSAAANASRASASFGAYGGGNSLCQSMDRLDAQPTEAVNGALRTDCVVHNNGSGYTVTVGSVGTSTLTLTPVTDSAGTHRITVLAIRIEGATIDVGTFALPTTVGEFDAFAIDKQIGWAMFLPSRQTSTGAGSTDAYGLFGQGYAARRGALIQQSCAVVSSDAGATSMVNKSQTSYTQSIRILGTDGAAIIAVETDEFQVSGNCRMNVLSTNGTACIVGYITAGNADTTPTITDWTDIQEGEEATITGTQFGSSGATLTIGGQVFTIDSQTDTEIVFTVPVMTALAYNRNYTMVVANASGSAAVDAARILPPSGFLARDMTATVAAQYRIKGTPTDVSIGVQALYPDTVAVFEDLSFEAAAAVGSFAGVKVFDGTWGAAGTITLLDPLSAPVFTGPIPNFVYEDASGSYVINAGPYFVGAEEFDIVGEPSGITIDPDTGAITVNTGTAAAGSYSVSVKGINAQGETSSNTFSIEITADSDLVVDVEPTTTGYVLTLTSNTAQMAYAMAALDARIPPAGPQIVAGVDGNGLPAAGHGSVALSAGVPGEITLTVGEFAKYGVYAVCVNGAVYTAVVTHSGEIRLAPPDLDFIEVSL